jgi:heptosyltransferase-2
VTAFSGAKETIGFDKNPLSSFFSKKLPHHISAKAIGDHEVKRNHSLITHLTNEVSMRPKLYPSKADYEKVKNGRALYLYCPSVSLVYQAISKRTLDRFHQCSPERFYHLPHGRQIRFALCDEIQNKSTIQNQQSQINKSKLQTPNSKIQNLAGQLSFLESAALMKNAVMNYVNDSAPLHFASAVNAPVTAIFCSTVPAFGFGPLSDKSYIVETKLTLTCRPCGLHGRKECPLGHFHCSIIETNELLHSLEESKRSPLQGI